jgi:magnesium-transporting ATPase (P-type)
VLLGAGQRVPADCLVIEANDLLVEEIEKAEDEEAKHVVRKARL